MAAITEVTVVDLRPFISCAALHGRQYTGPEMAGGREVAGTGAGLCLDVSSGSSVLTEGLHNAPAVYVVG